MLNRVCFYFNEKWPELIFELLFVALGAALGVFLGFYANNRTSQIQANKATGSRLHVMYLEINNENIPITLDLIEEMKKPNDFQTNVNRISLDAAKIAFADDNIHDLIPPETILLLQNYIVLGTTLDYWNQAYIRFAERYNNVIPSNPNNLKNIATFKAKITNNALKFAAICHLLHQELPKYFDKTMYSTEKTRMRKKQIKDKIKEVIEKINKGEYTRKDKSEK